MRSIDWGDIHKRQCNKFIERSPPRFGVHTFLKKAQDFGGVVGVELNAALPLNFWLEHDQAVCWVRVVKNGSQ